MDDEGETPVDDEGRPRDDGSRVPPSTWVGVAVIGAILFGVGVWMPAWRGIPDGANGIALVAAAGGAVLFIVGVTLAWRGYQDRQPVAITDLPGVEVFRPPTTSRIPVAEPAADDDER
jgi:hypothetical protein